MQIIIDTSQPISSTDADTLRLLLDRLGATVGSPSNGDGVAGTDAPPKTRARRKAKETPEEPAPEHEVADALDQELLDQAITKATELLKRKESALVKAALAKAGVQRVSHLNTNEQIRTVLDHFEEADE